MWNRTLEKLLNCNTHHVCRSTELKIMWMLAQKSQLDHIEPRLGCELAQTALCICPIDRRKGIPLTAAGQLPNDPTMKAVWNEPSDQRDVIPAVWREEDKMSIRSKNAHNLAKYDLRMLEVLDYAPTHHNVETPIRKR